MDKNLQMTYNPANMLTTSARLDFDEHVDVEKIVDFYHDISKTDAFWAKLSQEKSVEPQYLRELVDVSQTKTDELHLSATTGDRQLVEELLSLLLDALPEKPRKVTRIEPYVVADVAIMDWQRNQRNAMLALLNSLNAAYNNYNRLQEPKRTPRRTAQTVPSVGKALVKGGVLGCMAGVFAAFTLMALRLIMGGRVLSAGEFFGKYQYNCLAILPPRPRRRKMLTADRILLNWSDSSRFAKLSETERYRVAVENIKLHVKEGATLLLLGSVDARTLDSVRAALVRDLPDNPLVTRQFIDQHLPVMHDIDTHEHIVLVEKLYCSKYRDIDNEVLTIADRHKEIVGCILV